MKIALTVPSLTQRGGGVPPVVLAHAEELKNNGHEVSVCTFDGLPENVFTRLPGIRAWQYYPEYPARLAAAQPDLIHAHGIWMYHDFAAWRYAQKKGIPLIVSPHGMLDPWAVNNSKWKKRLIGALFENRILRNAACLHALNESEYQSIRLYGLKNPVAIIPNGTGVPDNLEKLSHSGRKRMLFLGRLHPKKGIPALLEAWGKLKRKNELQQWQLIVAGWDQLGHYQELLRKCRAEGLTLSEEHESGKTEFQDADVVFVGSKYGQEKEYLLKSSDAFILPSKSEGLPVAVLEAWAHGLPCLLTQECNLPEGFEAGAAVRIAPETASIEGGLQQFASLPETEREQIGMNGLALVKRKFSWESIGRQLLQTYQWCLDKTTECPSFIKVK